MKKVIALILAIIFLIPAIPAYAAGPVVTAPSAILIDAKSGKILYEKNANAKMYPASTTKVMTGILAVEYGKFDEVVTVGVNPSTKIERGSSQISLVPGEQLTMEQLLYGLMLESANDAAIAIAEQISGSVPEFAALMNAKAKALGATNTNFVNPNGLHDDNHYTTAHDLAMIAKYGMTLPKFREVVSTVKYTIPQTNKQPARDYITNGNKLIWKTADKYRYEYATGIKTGYTTKSKHCLVGGAKKGDVELISVIMGAEGSNMYTDTTSLFDYGFANYQNVDLVKKDQIVTTASVKGSDEKFNLLAADNFTTLLGNDERDKVKSDITVKENLEKPIKKGEVLGTVTYKLDDKELGKVDLLSSVELEKPVLMKKTNWTWIIYVIVIFLIYRTIITIIKRRKRRKRRNMIYVKRY